MEQKAEFMLMRHFSHRFHYQLVLVAREVCLCKVRREFKLAAGNFIVPRGKIDTQPCKVSLDIFHVGKHPGWDRSEVMILHLLITWRRRTEESPAAEADIRPLLGTWPVKKEKFLFPSHRCPDIPDSPVAEKLEHL